MKPRPLQSKDIVKIISGHLEGCTGVVNRRSGNAINVFVTQKNPWSIGIWFDIDSLKRIGRVR